MCLGPVVGEPYGDAEIIQTAGQVMTGRRDGDYCKGVAGYAPWMRMLSEDSAFSTENQSLLFAQTKSLAEQTWSLLGGWDNMEQRPAKLAEKLVREQACKYIQQIEALEEKCLELIK